MDSYIPTLTRNTRRWLRLIGLLLVAALLIWCARQLSAVLTPLVAALAIAYIFNPVVSWFERRGIGRLTTVLAIYLIGLGLLLALGVALYGLAVGQLADLADRWPRYVTQIKGWLAPEVIQTTSAPATRTFDRSAIVAHAGQLLAQHGTDIARRALNYLTGLVGNVVQWLTLLVLVPMYSFFFLWRFDAIIRVIHDHLPAAPRPIIVRIVTRIDRATADFFRGRLLTSSASGLMLGVGWTIVGVPYGLPLGFVGGVLNLVPYMNLLALPPALLLGYLDATAAEQPWVRPVVLAMGVYMLVQAIESFALSPLIESRANGLHPITTVIALLIGAQVAGLLGMLLSIPITSTLKSLFGEFVLPELRRLAESPEGGGRGPPGDAT